MKGHKLKANKRKRVYSPYSSQAVLLLASHIRANRITKKITEKSLTDRMGIAKQTYQKIEKGNLKVEIGLYFEAAAILGVKLFNIEIDDSIQMKHEQRLVEDRLSLLPKRVRDISNEVKDDF